MFSFNLFSFNIFAENIEDLLITLDDSEDELVNDVLGMDDGTDKDE